MRYSHQREAILQVVKGTKSHPTADMLYEEIKKTIPDISLGTVYRNLNLLVETGDIRALKTCDDKVHFDGDMSPHRHFVCSGCGKITDIFMADDIPEILTQLGYVVEDVSTVYYGKCADCLKK